MCVEEMTAAEVTQAKRLLRARAIDLQDRRADVAEALGVSVRTVQRMRERAGMVR
jgi:AraC-like DNA-binding protein